jgi:NAD(P)H-dependent flavin oxidoreductase YrpB (nitropropane dioxygenase family)
MHQVETVAEAERVIAAGVDVLIAQGSDGGGHVGKVGTMALVPAVVDVAGEVPVLAAGGIADGRGMAAALALGARGVLVGTRFLATNEAAIIPGWKEAILAARPEDAWSTDIDDLIGENDWPGATVRALVNSFMRTWHGRDAEIADHRAELQAHLQAADVAGDAEQQFLYAGASAGLIHEILPAAEVVTRMIDDARRTLRILTLP